LAGNVVLTLDRVHVHGRLSTAELAAWADPQLAGWRLSSAADGRLEASAVGRDLHGSFEPVLRDGVLLAELRGMRWRGVSVPVPRRLRIARRVPLPPLQDGFAILGLRRVGPHLDFAITLPPVKLAFWRP
ncbi:MAG: hypothetical protein JO027_13790, partial [Solirubrobacterales bacterium]|nr:hypothetical protein [Solirubrobacterales bacterium]